MAGNRTRNLGFIRATLRRLMYFQCRRAGTFTKFIRQLFYYIQVHIRDCLLNKTCLESASLLLCDVGSVFENF